jgi:hypothetical protein
MKSEMRARQDCVDCGLLPAIRRTTNEAERLRQTPVAADASAGQAR